MNTKRSHIGSLNEGRPRRPQASLEELSRTLERLEGQLQANQRSRQVPGWNDDISHRMQRLSSDLTRKGDRDEVGFSVPRRDYSERGHDSLGASMRGEPAGRSWAPMPRASQDGVREDVRAQLSAELKQEFDALRSEMVRAFSATASANPEVSAELERLSESIRTLAERSDDRGISLLRLELEQVKAVVEQIARQAPAEETERRLDLVEERLANRPDASAFEALSGRIDQLGDTLRTMPDSDTVRSLDEKVRALATAIEHMSRQHEIATEASLDSIETRLDEISRAIVAVSMNQQPPVVDNEPFERIEARLVSLGRQVEDMTDKRTVAAIMTRLGELSDRVDDLGTRAQLPEQVVERIGLQVAAIAERIENSPSAADAESLFDGLEQRFALLSDMLDRRQSAAHDQGQALFSDLERRLTEVAARIDRANQAAARGDAAMMDVIDARFAAFAEQLDQRRDGSLEAAAMRSLEDRLADISEQIDLSNREAFGVSTDLIRSLESQVASLAAYVERPDSADMGSIAPRLDMIERSISDNREAVVHAARQAAEQAVRSMSADMAPPALVELQSDLKSLEALTLRSDERNGRTFEAIHDTLLKIVERLTSLEDRKAGPDASSPAPFGAVRVRDVIADDRVPSLEISEAIAPPPLVSAPLASSALSPATAGPAPAATARSPQRSASIAAVEAAAAASIEDVTPAEVEKKEKKSLLGGLSKVLSRGRKTGPVTADPVTEASSEPVTPALAVPSVDLDARIDPKVANRPLEPGSGAPDLNAIMKRVRDERSSTPGGDTDAARSDFIAAARRAAQAAAAEAEYLKHGSDPKTRKAGGIGKLFSSKRKTALLATTALVVALAGYQLGSGLVGDRDEDAVAAAAVEPAKAQAITTPEPIEAAPVAAAAAVPSPTATEPTADEVVTLPAEDEVLAPDVAATEVRDEPVRAAEPPARVVEPQDPLPSASTGTVVSKAEEAPSSAMSTGAGDTATTETAALTPPAAKTFPAAPNEAGPAALREAADAGEGSALFEIGNRYAEGRGTKIDLKTAFGWYERAAETGLAVAQYRIGNMYEKGIGIDRDVVKAKTWYQLAATQGNASAMHNLAVLHAMGADGATDNESAARWFSEAADLGVRDSQFNLGILAAKGVGMPQDLIESYKWFALVAKSGDKDAAEKRDEIAKSLSPDDLKRARATAEMWKAKVPKPESNSISIPDSWRESGGQTAGIDMRQAVRNIQLILNKNGYDAGSADGVMGAKTKTAIASFQKANGMTATGDVDEQLVKKLLETR